MCELYLKYNDEKFGVTILCNFIVFITFDSINVSYEK